MQEGVGLLSTSISEGTLALLFFPTKQITTQTHSTPAVPICFHLQPLNTLYFVMLPVCTCCCLFGCPCLAGKYLVASQDLSQRAKKFSLCKIWVMNILLHQALGRVGFLCQYFLRILQWLFLWLRIYIYNKYIGIYNIYLI